MLTRALVHFCPFVLPPPRPPLSATLRLYDKEQIERLKEENAKQLAAQMEKLKSDNATQLAALKLDAQTRESVQQKALAERLEKRRNMREHSDAAASSLSGSLKLPPSSRPNRPSVSPSGRPGTW